MRLVRDTLTVLATLLTLGLIGMIVAPPFIDWGGQKARISALIEARLGATLAIAGDLRISLLPTPELDADRVLLTFRGGHTVSADRMKVQFSPLSLLGIEQRVTRARLDRPEIRLGDGLPTIPDRVVSALKGGLDRLDLIGASFVGKSGEKRIYGWDIRLEAPDLAGPYRIDILDPIGLRDFKAQIARPENGSARLRGVLEDKGAAIRATIDGAVALDPEARLFDGSMQITGNPLVGDPNSGIQIPFEASARLFADRNQVIADPANLTLGTGEGAAFFNGTGFLDLSTDRPLARLKMATNRLDPLRALPRRVGEKPIDLPAFIAGFAGGIAPMLPLDLALDLSAGALSVGGSSLGDVQLRLSADHSALKLDAAGLRLPGGATVRFERAVDAKTAVDGNLALEAPSAADLVSWLRGTPARVGLPASLTLASRLRLEPTGFQFPDLRIESAAGALAGSARLSLPRSKEAGAAQLVLDLAAERFDAKVLAALEPFRPNEGVQVSTRLKVVSLMLDGTRLGGMTVVLERDGARAHLRELRLTGRAGEELTLSGASDGVETALTGKLDAAEVEDIARLAAAILPGAISDGILARAKLLSPALAIANLRVETRAGDTLWDVALEGKLGGTSLNARSSSTHQQSGELILGINGDVSNENGARLLAQLAGGKPQAGTSAPGRVRLSAQGNPRRKVDLSFGGTLAGIDIDARGGLSLFSASQPLEGEIRLSSADISVLHRALGGGVPDLAPGTPMKFSGRFFAEPFKLTLTKFMASLGEMPVEGEISFDFSRGGYVQGQLKTGSLALVGLAAPALGRADFAAKTWSSQPLAPSLPPLLSGDLWIEGKSLTVAPELQFLNPQFVLRFGPGLAAIEALEAERDDARLEANVTLLRRADEASATGRIALKRVQLGPAGTRISGELPFSANGRSIAELAASVSGAGRMRVDGLVVPQSDPNALARLNGRALAEFGGLDENRVGAALDAELRREALALPSVEAPVTVSAGVLRFGGALAAPAGPELTANPALTFDLSRWSYEARLGLKTKSGPPGWRGAPPEIALNWTGSPAATTPPRRSLGVSSYLNGLLAISLQRDLEAAEAFDADARERAALLRRQRADRVQDRREAEIAAHLREGERKREEERKRIAPAIPPAILPAMPPATSRPPMGAPLQLAPQ